MTRKQALEGKSKKKKTKRSKTLALEQTRDKMDYRVFRKPLKKKRAEKTGEEKGERRRCERGHHRKEHPSRCCSIDSISLVIHRKACTVESLLAGFLIFNAHFDFFCSLFSIFFFFACVFVMSVSERYEKVLSNNNEWKKKRKGCALPAFQET